MTTSSVSHSSIKELMWISVSDPPLIDNAIYSMWVDGLPEALVSQVLQNSYRNVDLDFVQKYVEDQYKLFLELRSYLASPYLFDKHRSMFHIDGLLRLELIERYYTFDAAVVREIIGKKFGDKTRQHLSDTHSKHGINARSCTRQYENMRRIFKKATEGTGVVISASVGNIHSSNLAGVTFGSDDAGTSHLSSQRSIQPTIPEVDEISVQSSGETLSKTPQKESALSQAAAINDAGTDDDSQVKPKRKHSISSNTASSATNGITINNQTDKTSASADATCSTSPSNSSYGNNNNSSKLFQMMNHYSNNILMAADGAQNQKAFYTGNLVADLVTEFQFSKKLARRYTRITYAAIHGFEFGKKKLSHLSYKDIDALIAHMIKHWTKVPDEVSKAAPELTDYRQTSGRQPSGENDGHLLTGANKESSSPNHPHSNVDGQDKDDSQDISHLSSSPVIGSAGSVQDFMSSLDYSHPYPSLYPNSKMVELLSQIKPLIQSRKEELNRFAGEVATKLGHWNSSGLASAAPDQTRIERASNMVDYKFIKNIFMMTTMLGSPKEFKKIVAEMVDELVEPCHDEDLSSGELSELFRLLHIEGQSFLSNILGPSTRQSQKTQLCEAWSCFITGVKKCCLLLYSLNSS